MEFHSDFVYKEKKLPCECYKIFEDMRRKDEFCDVTLKVENRSIHAHRVILAASIPLFRSLFRRNGTESQLSEITITDVNPVALEALIDFAYKCEVKITLENAQVLLSAACSLQIDHVKKACVEFLVGRITPVHSLSLRNLAVQLDCLDLANEVDVYIKENFDEVSQCEEFLKLQYSYLQELISSDDLYVVSEEKVFEAVIRWVKLLPDERAPALPALLRCVRMPFLKLCYLRDHIATDVLVKESLACRDILDDARDYHLFPEKRCDIHMWKFTCIPRQYKNKGKGGYSCFSSSAEKSPDPNQKGKVILHREIKQNFSGGDISTRTGETTEARLPDASMESLRNFFSRKQQKKFMTMPFSSRFEKSLNYGVPVQRGNPNLTSSSTCLKAPDASKQLTGFLFSDLCSGDVSNSKTTGLQEKPKQSHCQNIIFRGQGFNTLDVWKRDNINKYTNVPLPYVKYHPSIDSSANWNLVEKYTPVGRIDSQDIWP